MSLEKQLPATPASSNTPKMIKGAAVTVTELPWGRNLVAFIASVIVRFLTRSLRYTWHYQPELLEPGAGPFIFSIWHNRCSSAPAMYRNFLKRRGETRTLAAIVSMSRDGSVMARILELFPVQPVRGSSSRRGGQALLELASWADRGYDLAITPDGPRGPRYVVQTGAIKLAQITGRPIVPVAFRLSWRLQLKSWDRHLIPLPFSKADMRSGKLLYVPRDATEAQIEDLRIELERRMMAITED